MPIILSPQESPQCCFLSSLGTPSITFPKRDAPLQSYLREPRLGPEQKARAEDGLWFERLILRLQAGLGMFPGLWKTYPQPQSDARGSVCSEL